MRDNKTLDSMIAAEQEKLDKLEEKASEIGKKIKACKANIERYTLMKNNQQFNALSNALDGKGISIEDILSAVAAGDLLSLQDKIENAENSSAEAEGEDSPIVGAGSEE
jgi:hypothetical protein